MYSELLRANKCLTNTRMKSFQAISRLAVKHLFRSFQKGIRANEYLLQSLKRAKDTDVRNGIFEYDIRSWNCAVKKMFYKGVWSLSFSSLQQ